MATYCDNCSGVPEFHVGGQCWCEDYCDCRGYVEGGMTIMQDSPMGDIRTRCRHCQTVMPVISESWFTDRYCRTCEYFMGDITSMQAGESVTVDFNGQPYNGFCNANGCDVCSPYYTEVQVYHVCYVDGGCHDCERGLPRRLPLNSYTDNWKCNGCSHRKYVHMHDGRCWECVRLHRKRCWGYVMKQPRPATAKAKAALAARIAEAKNWKVTAYRAEHTEENRTRWISTQYTMQQPQPVTSVTPTL